MAVLILPGQLVCNNGILLIPVFKPFSKNRFKVNVYLKRLWSDLYFFWLVGLIIGDIENL